MPQHGMPEDSMGEDSMPKDSMPEDSMPEDSMPEDSMLTPARYPVGNAITRNLTMSIRYYFLLADKDGHGDADPEFAFHSQGAEGLAQELEDALRTDALFQRWRMRQDAPDDVDPALGVTDPLAKVVGHRRDLKTELIVTTSIPGNLLKQRLRLLAGNDWTLRDVKSA